MAEGFVDPALEILRTFAREKRIKSESYAMDGELNFGPHRRRLPNRRRAITEDIAIGNMVLAVSIGLDEHDRPAELFMSGAKDGSGMAAVLNDASVVISVALQHGIPATALAKSISRAPDGMGNITAASVIGQALDLITRYEERRN